MTELRACYFCLDGHAATTQTGYMQLSCKRQMYTPDHLQIHLIWLQWLLIFSTTESNHQMVVRHGLLWQHTFSSAVAITGYLVQMHHGRPLLLLPSGFYGCSNNVLASSIPPLLLYASLTSFCNRSIGRVETNSYGVTIRIKS